MELSQKEDGGEQLFKTLRYKIIGGRVNMI